MGLDFTDIHDKHGAAVYILGDGTAHSEKRLVAYGEEIDNRTPGETQVVYLDHRSGDGLKVAQFYAITTFPAVLIIRDDDTIYQQWNVQLPTADQVAFAVSQVG